eukprot:TRINITY_DN2952_c1_g1_i1.p1 TRINITY_DN2952_c1_g1~~TRINITY_DN2952_c1_g1_i1.p1  ORF type:complete len:324 (-),score=2.36 TRINITY_DN2952_c1_g1_i1:182-1153(-)
MSLQVDVHLFLRVNGVILDVRTPEEYYNGHIPGALNLPLFENEERAKVGLCYKQRGREAAIELGLQCVGPKLVNMIQKAKQLAPQRKVCIYCWRGGMRSGSVSWLLQLAGFDVTTLKGGYKAFRRWACRSFSLPATINLLGGMTGEIGQDGSRYNQELPKQGFFGRGQQVVKISPENFEAVLTYPIGAKRREVKYPVRPLLALLVTIRVRYMANVIIGQLVFVLLVSQPTNLNCPNFSFKTIILQLIIFNISQRLTKLQQYSNFVLGMVKSFYFIFYISQYYSIVIRQVDQYFVIKISTRICVCIQCNYNSFICQYYSKFKKQ